MLNTTAGGTKIRCFFRDTDSDPGINLVPIYLNPFVLWTEDIPMTSAGSVNLILSSNFCGESSLHKYPGV